jgi:ABC-type multidrug transport system ATPase subunit
MYIVCSDLSFSWPDDTPVFDGLSFSAGTGRTGLVAPNGAGKSTLLKLIAGELRQTTGTVAVDGVVGYLPQSLPLTGDLTVAEVLGVAPALAALHAVESGDAAEEHFTTIGTDWDIEERSRAELDRLGLDGVALDRRLHTLSGGQAVSLGLAAQLLRRPDVLLLDEPTASLDPDTADWVRARLESFRQEHGATILLASHNMAEVERLCERVIMMKGGRIEDDDAPARLLTRYGRQTLEEVFLDVARGRGEAREAAQ